VQFPRATRLVIVFKQENDARRVMDVLPKRFGKYGLTLHPTKTKLVPFQKPSPPAPPKSGSRGGGSGTFDLLGFTHYWAQSKSGYWVASPQLEVARARRLLWHRGKPGRSVAVTTRGLQTVAPLAQPSIPTSSRHVGADEGDSCPLPAPCSPDQTASPQSLAKPPLEEPDAVVPHVRICGGPRATGGYPTSK